MINQQLLVASRHNFLNFTEVSSRAALAQGANRPFFAWFVGQSDVRKSQHKALAQGRKAYPKGPKFENHGIYIWYTLAPSTLGPNVKLDSSKWTTKNFTLPEGGMASRRQSFIHRWKSKNAHGQKNKNAVAISGQIRYSKCNDSFTLQSPAENKCKTWDPHILWILSNLFRRISAWRNFDLDEYLHPTPKKKHHPSSSSSPETSWQLSVGSMTAWAGDLRPTVNILTQNDPKSKSTLFFLHKVCGWFLTYLKFYSMLPTVRLLLTY